MRLAVKGDKNGKCKQQALRIQHSDEQAKSSQGHFTTNKLFAVAYAYAYEHNKNDEKQSLSLQKCTRKSK